MAAPGQQAAAQAASKAQPRVSGSGISSGQRRRGNGEEMSAVKMAKGGIERKKMKAGKAAWHGASSVMKSGNEAKSVA
jgi:hypothetical protein